MLLGLLYLVFVNDLLQQLKQDNFNTGIINVVRCAPALADDIACIATSPVSLQRMLDVCKFYACTWRFHQFNRYVLYYSFPRAWEKTPSFRLDYRPWTYSSISRIYSPKNLTQNWTRVKEQITRVEKEEIAFFGVSRIMSEMTTPQKLIDIQICCPSIHYLWLWSME